MKHMTELERGNRVKLIESQNGIPAGARGRVTRRVRVNDFVTWWWGVVFDEPGVMKITAISEANLELDDDLNPPFYEKHIFE
jgi:hypothetical protein